MPEAPTTTFDARARAGLYDRHAAGVYGLALHILQRPALAQAVTEDVFAALWQRGPTAAPASGAVAGWLRAEARLRSIQILPGAEEAAGRPPIPDAISQERLPEPERAVLARAYFGGRSARTIAKADGVSPRFVHALIRAGLERLASGGDLLSLPTLETA